MLRSFMIRLRRDGICHDHRSTDPLGMTLGLGTDHIIYDPYYSSHATKNGGLEKVPTDRRTGSTERHANLLLRSHSQSGKIVENRTQEKHDTRRVRDQVS